MNSSRNWDLMSAAPGSVFTLLVAAVPMALRFEGAPIDVAKERLGGIVLQ